MAQTKGSAKKPTAASQKQRVSVAMERNRKHRNVASVILFALGLLVLAFALIGDAFAVSMSLWDKIHGALCGLFGVSVYFVGPVIMYAAVMISADLGKSTIGAKLLQLVLIILLISGAMQIIFVGTVGQLGNSDFMNTVSYEYNAGMKLSGGGVIGLVLASPLLLFGRVGASIIVVLIVFVMIMIIANITLVDFVHFITLPFKRIGSSAKEKRELYKEESELIRDQREKEREIRNAHRAEVLAEMRNKKLESAEGKERQRKFASIEAVTTNAQQEVTPEEKEEAKQIPNPIVEQQKDNEHFRNELKEYITGRKKQEEIEKEKTVSEVEAALAEKGVILPVPNNDENNEEAKTDEEKEPIIEALETFTTEQKAEQKAAESTEEKLEKLVETLDDGQQKMNIECSEEQYKLPPIDLLNDIVKDVSDEDVQQELDENSKILVETLKSFGVSTTIIGVSRGPSVTRYELKPAAGVKISKITSLVDDIALNLASAGVRIEAPIPNKAAVGIEVPNKTVSSVPFRELVDTKEFRETKSKLGAVLGEGISGETVIADIAKMPHILIAGTTGSGKSVCVNSIIMSILFRSTPDEVRFLMIDPKAVEFMIYNGIPHLLIPVVTDPKKAAGALGWAVTEMLNRYKLFSDNNVRDLDGYNRLIKQRIKNGEDVKTLPQVVIFIDELADLMMSSPSEVESSICRLAQMARAAGMHLVIATQRPSVNVVTGVIKANIPSRIALKVASQVDSRTIIDQSGAEKLLGKGDMLYFPVGMPVPLRVQGCWVSDKEVERVVEFIKNSFILDYDQNVIDEIDKQAQMVSDNGNKGSKSFEGGSGDSISDDRDEKLDEAIELVIDSGRASTSYLQQRLKLGYGRAARLIDEMEEMGIVGAYEGSKPRQVLLTKQDWYEMKMRNTEE